MTPRPSSLLALAPLPEGLRAWASRHETFAETWAGCERPDWLLAMGVAAGLERGLVVAVACDCLERARGGSGLPEAWSMAKRWTRGEVDGREAWAAGFRASADARRVVDLAERTTLRAAAEAAFACDDEADDGYYALRAHAAEAARLAALLAPTRASALASQVRRRIDGRRVLDGLEALAERETTPPPALSVDGDGAEPLPPPVTPQTLLRLRSGR